jgi:hypothetical protein
MPILEIMSVISAVGTAATTGNALLDMISKVKGLLKTESPHNLMAPLPDPRVNWAPPPMQQFQPREHDPYSGGGQWLPQVRAVAVQQGNPWVPPSTAGFLGIDLTGVWAPPGNPLDLAYLRQFGPYLNLIAGIGGQPTLIAEGLYDPTTRSIRLAGRNFAGFPVECSAQLFPDWTIRGMMVAASPLGPQYQNVAVMRVA